MAEVYLARVEGLEDFKQYYAVKRILPRLVSDAKFVRMFLDEARVTVALQHPNIVQVHDLGEDRGNYYIAMEYVDGMDLRRLMTLCSDLGTTIPYKHVLFVTMEALRALDHAHNARDADGDPLHLIHRDVSPANVLLSRSGAVKLTDFGVSKAAIVRWETEAGEILGKYRYFAPELIRGDPPSTGTDIFALGAILFELVTGEPLLQGAQYKNVVKELRRFDPEQALERDLSMPTPLEPILLRALATEPGDRYSSASEFLEDLTDHVVEDKIRISAQELADFLIHVENASAPSGAPLGDSASEPPSISIVPIDERETDQEEAVPVARSEAENSRTEQLGWRFPHGGRADAFFPSHGIRSFDTRDLREGLTEGTVGAETLVRFQDDHWRPVYEYRRGQSSMDTGGQWTRLSLSTVNVRRQLTQAIRGQRQCAALCWCDDEVIALHLKDGWLLGVEGSSAPRSVVEILRADGGLSHTQGMVVEHIARGDDQAALAALAERKLVPQARLEGMDRRRMMIHLGRVLGWSSAAVLAVPASTSVENVQPCPLDDAVAMTVREHMPGGTLAAVLEPHRDKAIRPGPVPADESPVPLQGNERALLESAARVATLAELLDVVAGGSAMDATQAAFLLLQYELLSFGS